MSACILSIDQGTTSSRAMAFDAEGRLRAVAQKEHRQYFPEPGWVEHDAEEIWQAVLAVTRRAAAEAGGEIAAIGLTNQRETCLLWDAKTGAPLSRAIVWQDRRTADLCATLRERGHEAEIRRRTGLLLDPYFSATKLAWLLDHVPDARERAQRGEILAGTMDSYILWRLTGGRVHATDATNAARTLLFNIHDNEWDPWLLRLFDIPREILPEVRDCTADYGVTLAEHLGDPVRIGGIAGDQQAAVVGQACFQPGMIKATYGTGAFLVLNTGEQAVISDKGLLTTPAYRLDGRTTYALEGSIFNAGSAVQWMRDRLKLIRSAAETEALASSLHDNRGVYLVPAFTGLGAPHWRPDARAVLSGLTLDSGPAEIARAVLESVAYQTCDLVEEMRGAAPGSGVLRADGGMTANGFLMQFLADMLDTPVEVPEVAETTALGAAFLAGLQVGMFDDLQQLSRLWRRGAAYHRIMTGEARARAYGGWRAALSRL